MNFLAHAFLSGEDQLILVGNITGDTVRGIHMNNFPERIKKGVLLHRAIDEFTDSHPSVKKCKQLLSPYFNKYSGVAVDVYFDHFLSVNWSLYTQHEREKFIGFIYQQLHIHFHHLPEKSQFFVQFMIKNDWLGSYLTTNGIGKIMLQMSKRTKFETGFREAESVLLTHYDEINELFKCFFPELCDFSQKQLLLIN